MSILVNRNQRERGRREGGDKGDHHRLFLAVNPHLPPVPLAYPTVISLWGTAQLCQQLSCLVPLIHFNTRWWTHQMPRAMQDPYPPLFMVFKGSDEGMKIWKCSSQGSVKEAISIMPMSISYVEENNTFLWCSCTQSSSDSTSAEAYREGRTDWGSIKLLRRLTFFKTLYLVYTPGVCNHNHSKSLDWLISIFIYPELFVHIKLCGCPW